jgi:hypothetical protein
VRFGSRTVRAPGSACEPSTTYLTVVPSDGWRPAGCRAAAHRLWCRNRCDSAKALAGRGSVLVQVVFHARNLCPLFCDVCLVGLQRGLVRINTQLLVVGGRLNVLLLLSDVGRVGIR